VTRRRLLITLGAIIVVAMLIRAVIRSHTGAAPRAATTAARPVVSSSRWRPVVPGAPNTARAVLYRFVSAYGEVSAATVAKRRALLLSLAGPPLSSQLRAAGSHGGLIAVSDIRRRTSINSLLLKMRLTAPSRGEVHGTVTIEQWLAGPAQPRVAPLQSSYVADLVQVDGAWRIAGFRLVP
jgi:hypothetical protein